MAAAVGGLLGRFRLTRLAERHDSALVMGAFAFVNGCLGIAVMSAVALATGSPFVFPSLGPTAFLHFYTAMAPADRKSVVEGKSVSECVDMGGRRILKKKKTK